MKQLAANFVNLSPFWAGLLGFVVAAFAPSLILLYFYLSTSNRNIPYDANSIFVGTFLLQELFLVIAGFVAGLLAERSNMKVVVTLGVVIVAARVLDTALKSGLQLSIGFITLTFNVLVLTTVGGFFGTKLREFLTSPARLLPKVLAMAVVAVLLFSLSIVVSAILGALTSATPLMHTPLPQSGSAMHAATQTAPAPLLVQAVFSPVPTISPLPSATNSALMLATNSPTVPPSPPTAVPATPTVPPPGVYVTKLRMEPPNPNIVEDIRFFVTFWNTAGPLKFKWCVYVFNAGAQNPRGQTSCDSFVDFPSGIYEYATPNTWKLGPGTPCTDLIARVQGIDTNGARLYFKTPDLRENSFSFRVCP